MGVRSSFVGCDWRREWLMAVDAVVAEPGHAPLVRVRSGACSRAEAKGGGAPTGMSATAAVASRPIYTPPSLRRKRPNAVPVLFRADIPRIDAGDSCAARTGCRPHIEQICVPKPCQCRAISATSKQNRLRRPRFGLQHPLARTYGHWEYRAGFGECVLNAAKSEVGDRPWQGAGRPEV